MGSLVEMMPTPLFAIISRKETVLKVIEKWRRAYKGLAVRLNSPNLNLNNDILTLFVFFE